MSVLFSELLIPGWAEGEGAMIGLDAVTGVYGSEQEFTLPCHTSNPEIFFSDKSDEIAYAKSLCSACPVKRECLQGALSRKEPCGIWGGELFEEGVVIAAKRLPGRPKLTQEAVTSELIDEKVLVATA
jgi:WhiB family redox-sensing transcriptional regulator